MPTHIQAITQSQYAHQLSHNTSRETKPITSQEGTLDGNLEFPLVRDKIPDTHPIDLIHLRETPFCQQQRRLLVDSYCMRCAYKEQCRGENMIYALESKSAKEVK